jgi:hypothetical protein
MPYIPENERPIFESALQNLPRFETRGQVNYFLSSVVAQYLRQRKADGVKINYDELNDVKGMLSEVLDEFRSRLLKPYEKIKCAANGDIFGGILDLPKESGVQDE